MECKRHGITAKRNLPPLDSKVNFFGEELNFANNSHQKFYCSSPIFTARIVLETCMALVFVSAMVIWVGHSIVMEKTLSPRKMTDRKSEVGLVFNFECLGLIFC
ncbi:hypothetical protein EB796_008229 [Bugula neritina]|uniref:Uncharacterized protein n=1 Tax=Bugula neritina TaxID=10212 RepID=A0A7J7K5I4_BUGNE|nr:hypothetical protein EB796_008229 [Bugula neritina]